MSADGQVMLLAPGGGALQVSVDKGVTWTNTGVSAGWFVCSVSASGRCMLAGGGGSLVHVSRDYGTTWNTIANLPGADWRGFGITDDGLVLAAVANNGVPQLSTDGGASWVAQTAAGTRTWTSLKMSKFGELLLLSDNAGATGGLQYEYCHDTSNYLVARGQVGVFGLASVAGDVVEQGVLQAAICEAVQALDVECGGQGRIYGPVELYNQAGNIPLARRVRLHRSRDGMLVRETWSDAQGNYCFDGISERYKYDVIAWDHEGLQQSVVANDLMPEVMP